ncbi:MAG: 4-hydroxy-tetrahydrodipicolinate synthase [Acidimicrobiaceae bacterium]|nr:4-hydroxy-tetrahydrodipicolinate synthase [Acidimicrobiaceae bacterium]
MAGPRFGYLLTAMVTPFEEDGTLALDVARDLAQHLVQQGNDALVVGGSTGEGSSLSDSEKLDLFSAVAQAVTVPVLAGTTSSDTARSVQLTSRTAATGVAGILATTPAYARPSQRGIAAHFGAVAESTSLPIMLYDIPIRTGRKVAAATTIDVVRRHSNVVALKDASADLVGAAGVKAELGQTLDLYSGDDALLLAFLSVGAVGLVSVAAHWAAPEFAALIRSAHAGDWNAARLLNARLAPSCIFETSDMYPNPLPSKAAMRALGFAVGQCRLPLGPSDEVLDQSARDVVSALAATRG